MYLAALFYAILMLFVLIVGIAVAITVGLLCFAFIWSLKIWLSKALRDFEASKNS